MNSPSTAILAPAARLNRLAAGLALAAAGATQTATFSWTGPR